MNLQHFLSGGGVSFINFQIQAYSGQPLIELMPVLFHGSVIKPAVLTLAKLSPGFYPAPNPKEDMGFLV